MAKKKGGSPKSSASQRKTSGKPVLEAERLSLDVLTLPLFVHERLSTRGTIETLKDEAE